MNCLVITNNPQAPELLSHLEVLRVEGSVLDIYILARDYIHKGHFLITHPLSGSLKPGKTPYKSVVLSGERKNLDLQSLHLIESSIETYHNTFSRAAQKLKTGMLKDYATIDLSHLEAALESLNSQLNKCQL